MANRYWIGANQTWHDAANWSATSGGGGGAGIPTVADDVFFDGSGNVLCWPTADIVCNDMTLLATMTEMLVIDANAVIHGDFNMQGGYFTPTGGPDHLVEFQGDWLNTGGTFSVGTGVGEDPKCIFSGIGKDYNLNSTAAASFQNVLISGEITITGTRLSQMEISQKLSVTGTMTINKNGWKVCRVTLSGGFDVFTGTLTGTGRLHFTYEEGDDVPTTGIISIGYFTLHFSTGLGSGAFDQDLVVDGWTNVNNDWNHTGIEPWIDDGDGSSISLPADSSSDFKYDEYYDLADITGDPLSIVTTGVRVNLRARLQDGTGGHAMLAILTAYIWDGTSWVNAGSAFFNQTSYADREISTSIHVSIDTLAKANGMRLKIEVAQVIGGGLDKGTIEVAKAWVHVEGTASWNPVFELSPRTWASPAKFEVEYTDDVQSFCLKSGKHYFLNGVTIKGNDSAINTALYDCDKNEAQMWVEGSFDVYKNAFPNAIFTLDFGEGPHVFRGSIDFYFSYSSASTHLVVKASKATMILWPKGRQLVPIP